MATRFSRPLLRRVPATLRSAAPCVGVSKVSSSQTFANAGKSFDESLKRDFKRWLKSEVVLLACMVAAGAAGVHLYQVQSIKKTFGYYYFEGKYIFLLTCSCLPLHSMHVRAEPWKCTC